MKSFKVNNWLLGRLVELCGNTITMDGVKICLDNPLVSTRDKSTLYFYLFEKYEREFSQQYIDRSLPLVELGGSIGGVACTTNRILADPSKHVVLECNPVLLPTLERNRELNDCAFKIEPAALAYNGETASFNVASHFMLGQLDGHEGKQIVVPATTLERIIDKYQFDIFNIVSDIQGGEIEMVENEGDLLMRRVKWLIMEIHEEERGAAATSSMLIRLKDLGFEIRQRHGQVLAMENRRLVSGFRSPHQAEADALESTGNRGEEDCP